MDVLDIINFVVKLCNSDWSVVAHVEVKVKNFNNPDKSYVKGAVSCRL